MQGYSQGLQAGQAYESHCSIRRPEGSSRGTPSDASPSSPSLSSAAWRGLVLHQFEGCRRGLFLVPLRCTSSAVQGLGCSWSSARGEQLFRTGKRCMPTVTSLHLRSRASIVVTLCLAPFGRQVIRSSKGEMLGWGFLGLPNPGAGLIPAGAGCGLQIRRTRKG